MSFVNGGLKLKELKVDNIKQYGEAPDSETKITVTPELKIVGGLSDTDVVTSINLGDSSNTTLNSNFTATSLVGAINENRTIFSNMMEPSGFLNTTDQESTFVNGSRLFTISPAVSSFTFYVKGKKFVKTGSENTTIDNTEGLHLIYYNDSGVLSKIVNPSNAQISTVLRGGAFLSYIYWDLTNTQQIYFTGDNEYHGITMDGATHSYLQLTRGTQFLSGCAINTIDTDQDGTEATHAQFGIDLGVIIDEDISTNLSAVSSTTGLPVYYYLGSAVPRRTINTNYPIITTGTGRAAYNKLTGGVWSLAEVGDGNYVLVHVFATNDETYGFIAMLGQTEYTNISDARTGANNEMSNIVKVGLPFIEFVPIATIIYQTDDTFTGGVDPNLVKSKTISTDLGNDYVDWKFTKLSPSITPSTHSNLSGLANDDHTQYALLNGRSGDILKIDTLSEYTGSNGVLVDETLIKDKTIYPNSSNTDALIQEDTGELIFNVGTGNTLDFKINNAIKLQIDTATIRLDALSEYTGSGGITVNNFLKLSGGLQDDDVTATINLGDSSNTALDGNFTATSLIGAINENMLLATVMHEPTGFADTSQLNCTFADLNRRVSLTPTATNFTLYIKGKKYVKTTETYDISDANGLHYVYYNTSGVLTEIVNPTHSQLYTTFEENTIVCVVYWHVSDATQYYFTGNNDLHGIQMDNRTQSYLFISEGMRYVTGSLLTEFVEDGGGGLATHARFSIEAGEFINEDIYLSLSRIDRTDGNFTIYYKLGTEWKRLTSQDYPVVTTSGDNSTRIAYNENGNSFSQVSTDGYYTICHIFACSDSTYGYIIIMGQEEYSTLGSAKEAACSEMQTLATVGLPITEMTPIGCVIFQTDLAYGNAVNARIVSYSTVDSVIYIDMRKAKISQLNCCLTHNTLIGKRNDDHVQYALLDGRTGDTLLIDTINEFTSNNGVDVEGVKNKDFGIIFPNVNKVDKIELMGEGNDYEIGTTSGHIKFKIGDITKEFQWAFLGTVRCDFALVDTNVFRMLNPNGLIEIEDVLFNGNTIDSIKEINFIDENKTDKILLRPTHEIGIRNNDMHFEVPTGEEIEFQINNDDIMRITGSGVEIDNLYETTASNGIIANDFISLVGGLRDTNVTSTVYLGSATNTAISTSFIDQTIIGAINESRGAFEDSLYPAGFVNTSDQTSVFGVGTIRRFTLSPSVSSFSFYVSGKKFTKTGDEIVTVTDDEGLNVIYYNSSGVLTFQLNPTAAQIKDIILAGALVAFVYWDTTNNIPLYFTGNNEYHLANMPASTHYYLHNNTGTLYRSGCALETFDIDGSGIDASHAQFGVSVGSIMDEDLTIDLAAIASTTGLPVYYYLGTGSPLPIRRTINAGYPIITTGTGRAAYNLDTAGTWSLAEVGNNDFVLVHVFATNDSTYPYIVLLGQATYGNIAAARTGASTEINNIVTAGLPFSEFLAVGSVIYQTSNGYTGGTNTTKSRTRTTDTGENYVNWVYSNLSPSATPSDHGNLIGLTNDDHTQYMLLAGRSGGQTLIGGVDASDDLTFQTTSNVSKGSYIFSELTASKLLGIGSSSELITDPDLTSYIVGTANEITVTGTSVRTISLPTTIQVNGIDEIGAGGTGVTVDNVLLKDGSIHLNSEDNVKISNSSNNMNFNTIDQYRFYGGSNTGDAKILLMRTSPTLDTSFLGYTSSPTGSIIWTMGLKASLTHLYLRHDLDNQDIMEIGESTHDITLGSTTDLIMNSAGTIKTDTISEASGGLGVTIESNLLNNGQIHPGNDAKTYIKHDVTNGMVFNSGTTDNFWFTNSDGASTHCVLNIEYISGGGSRSGKIQFVDTSALKHTIQSRNSGSFLIIDEVNSNNIISYDPSGNLEINSYDTANNQIILTNNHVSYDSDIIIDGIIQCVGNITLDASIASNSTITLTNSNGSYSTNVIMDDAQITGLTASKLVETDGSKNLQSVSDLTGHFTGGTNISITGTDPILVLLELIH
jgi:hypothetical protein